MAASDAIRVRDAGPEDAALFAGFNAAMARETEGKDLDESVLLRGSLGLFEQPQRGRYFLAESAQEPFPASHGETPAAQVLGGCLVTYEWSDWRAGTFWWLQSVYVLPQARRRGGFRALYDHVLGLARATPGVVGLRLYVERENERAQAVYRAVGMTESAYRLFEIDFVLGEPGA